jgi:hypothetical protein
MTRRILYVALFAVGLVAVGLARAAADEPKPKLPQAVVDALSSKFPEAKIVQWTKETENGLVIYDIEVSRAGRKAEADIAEDGAIQNFEREFDAAKLPQAVRDAAENRYPRSKLKEVMELTEIKDKREVDAGFEIVLETPDKKEVEIAVTRDGKIYEDSGAK